jgi:hypothetical protein
MQVVEGAANMSVQYGRCASYFSLNFINRWIRSYVWKPLIITRHLRFPGRWMWSVSHKINRSLFHMYKFISHVAVDIFIHTYLRFRLFSVEPQLYYYKLSFRFWGFAPINIGIVIIWVVAILYHRFNFTKTKLGMNLDYILIRIQSNEFSQSLFIRRIIGLMFLYLVFVKCSDVWNKLLSPLGDSKLWRWRHTLTRSFRKFNHCRLQKPKRRRSCTDDICISLRALSFHKNTNQKKVLWSKILAVCCNTRTEHISMNNGLTRCRILLMLNMVVLILNTTLRKLDCL